MKYILIHGSWHGAWAFEKLVPFLKAQAHQVDCSDMPGSGEEAANAASVVFDDLYAHVFDAIDASDEPVIVVAHSFSGFIAAQVCEQLHHKVQHVYYVAAWLPREGWSLVDMARSFNNSDLPNIFADCGDPRLRAVDPEGAKWFFYHDCSPAEQIWASAKLRPKAAQPDNHKMPKVTPIHTLTKSTYILCSNDRVVNPLSQREMAERFGFEPDQIKTLASGHSPFLSMPRELAALIGQ
jgi:pimeloyl-ACP methyl ester carboxylesterase